MAHGKFLISGGSSVTAEDKTIALTNGYPTANTAFTDAVGLNSNDFTVTPNATSTAVAANTTTNTPAIPANSIVVVPASVVGTATALNCFVYYQQAASGGAPTVGPAPTSANCGGQ
jgi:MSHA pilin protein MshA